MTEKARETLTQQVSGVKDGGAFRLCCHRRHGFLAGADEQRRAELSHATAAGGRRPRARCYQPGGRRGAFVERRQRPRHAEERDRNRLYQLPIEVAGENFSYPRGIPSPRSPLTVNAT